MLLERKQITTATTVAELRRRYRCQTPVHRRQLSFRGGTVVEQVDAQHQRCPRPDAGTAEVIRPEYRAMHAQRNRPITIDIVYDLAITLKMLLQFLDSCFRTLLSLS
jgi:hypothetical protein